MTFNVSSIVAKAITLRYWDGTGNWALHHGGSSHMVQGCYQVLSWDCGSIDSHQKQLIHHRKSGGCPGTVASHPWSSLCFLLLGFPKHYFKMHWHQFCDTTAHDDGYDQNTNWSNDYHEPSETAGLVSAKYQGKRQWSQCSDDLPPRKRAKKSKPSKTRRKLYRDDSDSDYQSRIVVQDTIGFDCR